MRHDDSREELLFLQKQLGPQGFVDHMWIEREKLHPVLKPSTAWPYCPVERQAIIQAPAISHPRFARQQNQR